MENSKKSFVFVLKRGSQSHVTPEITKPALVLVETCIKEFDFGMSLMGRAKDVSAIPNLLCIISKEGFKTSSFHILEGCGFSLSLILSLQKINFSIILMTKMISLLMGKQEGDVANKADNNESHVDRVSESRFMHENNTAHKDVNICKKREVGSHSEDPFNIYDNNDQEKSVEENIKDTTQRVQSLSNKLNDRCSNRGFSSQQSMNSHSQKSKVGGSILDLMDELVTVGQTMGYNMAGCE
nr:RNA-directed DNA polymerase, eukaryota, nucleotide-binding alpha-beta plait domain protein [Tanacetum cinerariifolium]